MTHGELVDIAIVKDLNKLIRKQMKAIDAVVELHKPRVNLDFPYQPVCQQCANIIDPWDENSYPCPTIQAIEEQLK